jgi:protocatechuate 3,4-dioxygenase beta subunit
MTTDIEHEEIDDDAPKGRVLSRREVLGLLAGLGGAVVLAACDPLGSGSPLAALTATPGGTGAAVTTPTTAATATAAGMGVGVGVGTATATTATAATPTTAADTGPAITADCVVKPEMTEGPYFVDEKINRSDVRSDTATGAVKEGVPLALTFLVSLVAANACKPLQGAQVDIWHCDATGMYSDTNDPSGSTVEQNYLRGYQLTDATGKAGFTTIYPGWYSGRAVHIHFKIRTTGMDGAAYEFTSQLFFDDALSDEVFKLAPYAAKGTRNTRNSRDSIYNNGGAQMLLAPTQANGGYSATFSVALDLLDTSVGASDSVQNGGGGPGGQGRP